MVVVTVTQLLGVLDKKYTTSKLKVYLYLYLEIHLIYKLETPPTIYTFILYIHKVKSGQFSRNKYWKRYVYLSILPLVYSTNYMKYTLTYLRI